MIARDRRIVARFSIGRPDGQTWEDLTGYLVSATINLGDVTSLGTGTAGIDERVRTATFTLAQERAGASGDSLSPRDRTSAWNTFGGKYAPLIWPRREVYLEVALIALEDETGGTSTVISESLGTGDGTTKTFYTGKRPLVLAPNVPLNIYLDGVLQESGYTVDYDLGTITFDAPPALGVGVTVDYIYWHPLFHGMIDNWQIEGGRIVITCRDLAARLQDLYLLEPAEYGSEQGVPLETVIQQMLDDHLGPGVVQLYCPVSPGFMVTSYVAEYVTLWEALQTLASQTVGWYLGYRWRAETGRFELTLLEPPRDKSVETADYHLTAREDILVNDLGGSIADVRNFIKITYRDSATGERRSVTVSDQPSIDEYGLRPMAIEEADTSPIDTEAEALALANAALSDLKDQHATTQLELPLLPWLDLMDGVTIEDLRTSSTVDFYAVESVEHRLDWSDPERAVFRTSAVCSGKVAGAHVKWLAMQTRPGAKGEPTKPPTSQVVPLPPANLRLVASGLEIVEQITLTYLDLAWEPVTNIACDHYLLRWRKTGTAYWEMTTVPRGTDSAPRRIGRLPGNVGYDIEVAGISRAGVQGAWSTQLTVTTPRETTPPAVPLGVRIEPGLRSVVVYVDAPKPPDDIPWRLTRVRLKGPMPAWPDETAREETEVVGDETDVIGDEVDGAEALINLLFDTTHSIETAVLDTAEGRQTRFPFAAGTQAGTTYYADAQYEDTSGNVSEWSPEVSAVAGGIDGTEVTIAFEIQDDDGNTLFKVDKPTGDAYFKGAVEAGAFILPVRDFPL